MALTLSDKKKVRPLPGSITQQQIAGAAGSLGDAVYIDSSGKVRPATAGTLGGAASHVRGVVTASSSLKSDGTFAAEDTVTVVVFGPIAGWSGMAGGGILYLSPSTAGQLTETKPSTSTQQVVVVGYAQTEDIIFVQPQSTAPVSGA